ncbi:hypothetical protein ACIRQH_34950 [Streptomyces sp. NPDC102279]|uniref:hypothetical protein n=1 Tax=Streptomyces sp. NPDC102279 TaxID=3366153 RepID=UPI00381B7BE1
MPNADGTPYNPADALRSSSNGRFQRNPATAHRDAEAARLRSQGRTYQQIADELKFGHRKEAQTAVDRAISDVVREPATAVLHFELERLDAELVRLDALELRVRQVLDARHITVNNGRVIVHPETGAPMEDDAPVLQATDRLLKIEEARRRNGERRAKLTGIEAAVKVDATVHQVTQQDLELQEMLRDARAKTALEEQQIRDGAGSDG